MATESHQPASDPQNGERVEVLPTIIDSDDLPRFIGAYVAQISGKADTWNPGETAPPKAITLAITLVCIPEPDDTREVFAAAVADDLRGELIQMYHVPAITLVGMVDTEDPGDGTTEQPEPITVAQSDDSDPELQDIPY